MSFLLSASPETVRQIDSAGCLFSSYELLSGKTWELNAQSEGAVTGRLSHVECNHHACVTRPAFYKPDS